MALYGTVSLLTTVERTTAAAVIGASRLTGVLTTDGSAIKVGSIGESEVMVGRLELLCVLLSMQRAQTPYTKEGARAVYIPCWKMLNFHKAIEQKSERKKEEGIKIQ